MISVYPLNCAKCLYKAHIQWMKLKILMFLILKIQKKKRISELKYKKRVIPPNEHFGFQF